MLEKYDALCRIIEKATIAAVAALLVEMLAVAWAHVFCRYVLDSALIWSEELLRFSLVWFALLSASLMFRRKGHLGIVLFVDKFPEKLKDTISVIIIYLFLAVNIIVVFQGFFLLGKVHNQLTPALRIPVSIPYSAVPVSFLFMVIYGISDAWRRLLHSKAAKPGEILRQ